MDTWKNLQWFFLEFFYVRGALKLNCITCCCHGWHVSRRQTLVQVTSPTWQRNWCKMYSTWVLGNSSVAVTSLNPTWPQEQRESCHCVPLFMFVHLRCQHLSLSEWTRREMGQMSVMAVSKTSSQIDLLSQSIQEKLLVKIYFRAKVKFTLCFIYTITDIYLSISLFFWGRRSSHSFLSRKKQKRERDKVCMKVNLIDDYMKGICFQCNDWVIRTLLQVYAFSLGSWILLDF